MRLVTWSLPHAGQEMYRLRVRPNHEKIILHIILCIFVTGGAYAPYAHCMAMPLYHFNPSTHVFYQTMSPPMNLSDQS